MWIITNIKWESFSDNFCNQVLGLTRQKTKNMGIPIVSHDLLLFDDNIKIPFYLRYPGFSAQKIEEQINGNF